jgi:hypothetical protein
VELATGTEPSADGLPASATTTPEAPELEPLGSPSDAPVASLNSGTPAGFSEAAAGPPSHADTREEAVLREALKLMNDLAGVKEAMAMLAEQGQAPNAARTSPRPDSVPASGRPSPAPSSEQGPLAGSGAPSAAAGGASSGTGSAALYALVIDPAALAGGLWARLQLVPVRWRSVTIVALNERPG